MIFLISEPALSGAATAVNRLSWFNPSRPPAGRTNPPTIAPASERESGPSNHTASAPQATPATTIADNATVTIERSARRIINGFRVFVKDAADLLYCLGGSLSRVTRAHDQLGFDAVDMGALVLDYPIVAVLYRSVPLHRND
jgi:hypothetical protein